MAAIANSYQMHCDHDGCEHGYADYEGDGETSGDCEFNAMKRGWVEVTPGVWHCPACAAVDKGEPKPVPEWGKRYTDWERRIL